MSMPDQKSSMAQELWLIYFNRVAFEKGLITEAQRNQMKNIIAQRYGQPRK